MKSRRYDNDLKRGIDLLRSGFSKWAPGPLRLDPTPPAFRATSERAIVARPAPDPEVAVHPRPQVRTLAQTLEVSEDGTTRAVTLRWTPVPDAIGYMVEDGRWGIGFFDARQLYCGTGTEFSFVRDPLEYLQRFKVGGEHLNLGGQGPRDHFRVRAIHSCPGADGWSHVVRTPRR